MFYFVTEWTENGKYLTSNPTTGGLLSIVVKWVRAKINARRSNEEVSVSRIYRRGH